MHFRPEAAATSRAKWLLWGTCVIVSGVIWLAPGMLSSIRPWLLDAVGPGLGRLQPVSLPVADHNVSETTLRIAALEAANRKLELHAAALEQRIAELKQRTAAPLDAVAAPPLLVHTPQVARVLGNVGEASSGERRLILNVGRQSSLQGDELVLGGALPQIDLGEDTGLRPDDLVLSGQMLWGRIAETGRWTSTVQKITDPEFRLAVRLVRSSSRGPVFGARGILRGNGSACILEQLPATEPVTVGDHIYTDAEIAAPVPLYCGTVLSAELQESDSFWTITVLPAARTVPDELTVLKPQLNPERTAESPSTRQLR